MNSKSLGRELWFVSVWSRFLFLSLEDHFSKRDLGSTRHLTSFKSLAPIDLRLSVTWRRNELLTLCKLISEVNKYLLLFHAWCTSVWAFLSTSYFRWLVVSDAKVLLFLLSVVSHLKDSGSFLDEGPRIGSPAGWSCLSSRTTR